MLAAGIGQRMLPLTLCVPKPAIPVLGRPLAVQILRRLAQQGVDEAVLNLHHLPGVIRRVLEDGGALGLPPIRYTHEETILGTGGGLRHAAGLLRGSDPIVVCNSDFLADFNLAAAVEAHRRSGLLATLVLTSWRPGYSVVEVGKSGRILSLGGRPEVDPSQVAGRYLFTGLHVIAEEVLDRIPDTVPSHIVSDVYQDLAAEGQLGACIHEGFWWEFGSPEMYLEGSLRLLDCPKLQCLGVSDEYDPIRQLDGAIAAVGPGTVFHPTASFAGRAAFGFASHVSQKARIRDSVIMPEAWIGPHCKINRSVIAQGVELPAGFVADEMLICPDLEPAQSLPPRTRREGGLLVHDLATQPAG